MIFLGILLIISDGATSTLLSDKCYGKESVADFKKCVSQISPPFITEVNVGSYEQRLHVNPYFTSQIIIPSDGSIGTSLNNGSATLHLNPSYAYYLYLFDQDFFLYISNPNIVQRSLLKIRSNSSFICVFIKVSRIK